MSPRNDSLYHLRRRQGHSSDLDRMQIGSVSGDTHTDTQQQQQQQQRRRASSEMKRKGDTFRWLFGYSTLLAVFALFSSFSRATANLRVTKIAAVRGDAS